MQEIHGRSQRKVKLRSVALPAEHGGWGFLLEPVALGLLVAPSAAGLLLSAGSAAVFLLRQPAKLAFRDLRYKRWSLRTAWALGFVGMYGFLALLAFSTLIARSGPAFLIPFGLATPFIIVQLAFDVRNRSRDLIPELSGPLGLAAIAPAIATLSGWEFLQAMLLWVVISARSVPAVVYIRTRIRLTRGQEVRLWVPDIAHTAALVLVAAFSAAGWLPILSVLAMAILLIRSALGLSGVRRPYRTVVLGVHELMYGALTVGLTALGIGVGL